jgi:hypothetical protein
LPFKYLSCSAAVDQGRVFRETNKNIDRLYERESIHGYNTAPFKLCRYASTASFHTAVNGDPHFPVTENSVIIVMHEIKNPMISQSNA